jgi:hypothetical protein
VAAVAAVSGAAASGAAASGVAGVAVSGGAGVARSGVAGVAGSAAAAHDGERAACAKSHEKRRCDGRRITSGLAQQPDKLGVGRHFAKVHKSSILTAQYLLLALDNALKRMPMFAGKRDHLRRLCLCYSVRVSPALGDSFIMKAEHEMHCTFAIHVESSEEPKSVVSCLPDRCGKGFWNGGYRTLR